MTDLKKINNLYQELRFSFSKDLSLKTFAILSRHLYHPSYDERKAIEEFINEGKFIKFDSLISTTNSRRIKSFGAPSPGPSEILWVSCRELVKNIPLDSYDLDILAQSIYEDGFVSKEPIEIPKHYGVPIQKYAEVADVEIDYIVNIFIDQFFEYSGITFSPGLRKKEEIQWKKEQELKKKKKKGE